MRQALVDPDREAVVSQRVALGVREEKATGRRTVDEIEDWNDSSVAQRLSALSILAAHIGPADEVGAVLTDVRSGDGHSTADLPVHANGVLVGVWRAHVGIEQQVSSGVDH
jgi:hypothetical protein